MKPVAQSLKVIVFLFIKIFFIIFPNSSLAESVCPTEKKAIAEVVSIQGQLTLNKKKLSVNDIICPGNIILETQTNSRAIIRMLHTGVQVRLDQNTELRMDTAITKKTTTINKDKSFIELVCGAIHSFTRKPYKLDVRTPFVTAGVEGTEFLVEACENRRDMRVHVFEGHVRMLYKKDGKRSDLDIFSNEAGYAKANQAPKKIEFIKIKSRDQVEWALYYPPLSGSKAIEQASTLLSAGRLNEAEKLLTPITENHKKSFLEAIIQVAKGKSHKILQDPDWIKKLETSSESRLALSYVYQANLQLKKALHTLENNSEKDALIWARIAELRLAHGDIQASANAIKNIPIAFHLDECHLQAKKNTSDYIAKILSVKGFTRLAKKDTHQAISEFQCAILFASEDPLPRFGLGLAKIKLNKLQEGRHEIETAALLDPTNALIRSYLAKAFYEEGLQFTQTTQGKTSDDRKNSELAEQQFEIAKQLDPNDPTPWFYQAIKKQSENQPIAALYNLEQAVDKNYNRAVYRSRFLLDDDLASRNASLGRIYDDLGFQQLGLLQGWESVNTEPGNHSGHRLLADIYANLPRYETARVNELFLSQLLQPLNTTPIQPQLAEKNLSILSSAGPSKLSFNEFNPLFQQNGLSLQSSAVIGGNNTFGEDITLAGLFDKWAFSLGHFHFETDGFRENNDLTQNVHNLFLQFQPVYNTSFLFELRNSEREQGDLTRLFDRENFDPYIRINENIDSIRGGFQHRFNQQSQIITSYIYQHSDLRSDLLLGNQIKRSNKGYTAELQYHLKQENWFLNSGFRYSARDQTDLITLNFFLPGLPSRIRKIDKQNNRIEQSSLYFYSYLQLLNKITLTLGGSYDSLNGRSTDKDLFNPKIGLSWQLSPNSILRTALFKNLQGPTFSRQDAQASLEPTQIAGFNQNFFGTEEGEDSWHYTIALDHSFSKNLYSGIEFSKRNYDTPFIILLVEEQSEISREEYYAQAYVHWSPRNDMSISTSYRYDKRNNRGEHLKEFSKNCVYIDCLLNLITFITMASAAV